MGLAQAAEDPEPGARVSPSEARGLRSYRETISSPGEMGLDGYASLDSLPKTDRWGEQMSPFLSMRSHCRWKTWTPPPPGGGEEEEELEEEWQLATVDWLTLEQLHGSIVII